ncbi:metal-dependent hydrolase [Pontibacter qinzhouensis]|uniref:Metal-dependent hydrolase n=1 Tax=Pontibacter qinzhouensis TaxID=2603253 RepID=A0A5C8KC90_9BACT|nr:metal-dependent hydrolase [Pontibacter qinzhouensis]TXK51568.1 metal-dependent hydrolase [Pontibacter qinzhouensis]
MASAFAHALAAVAIGKAYSGRLTSAKFWFLGIVCAIVPDADVVMFKLGVPYEHALGHRGFSHSLVFALLLGIIITAIFYRNIKLTSQKGLLLILFFSLCTASHILLDALTNGGLGVAVFAPFNNTRYFLPWRPIQVSPIGVGNFFSEWGWRVIKSELVWVGIPSAVYMLLTSLLKSRKLKQRRPSPDSQISNKLF